MADRELQNTCQQYKSHDEVDEVSIQDQHNQRTNLLQIHLSVYFLHGECECKYSHKLDNKGFEYS